MPVFRRFRKIAKGDYYLPLRLSVRTEKVGSNWMDFHENMYLNVFRKSVKKIQVLLRSD